MDRLGARRLAGEKVSGSRPSSLVARPPQLESPRAPRQSGRALRPRRRNPGNGPRVLARGAPAADEPRACGGDDVTTTSQLASLSPERKARRSRPEPVVLSRDEARTYLLGQLALNRPQPKKGAAGVRALLAHLRCIQLDPLDTVGTNADLVALARVDGLAKGEVYRHLLPGHAFEHFAKERCLLPASAFPLLPAPGSRDTVVAPWRSARATAAAGARARARRGRRLRTGQRGGARRSRAGRASRLGRLEGHAEGDLDGARGALDPLPGGRLRPRSEALRRPGPRAARLGGRGAGDRLRALGAARAGRGRGAALPRGRPALVDAARGAHLPICPTA
jgi:hypothetical protein